MRNDTRWHVGRDPRTRTVLFLLISLIAWIYEAFLLSWVFSNRPQHAFRLTHYAYPIIHLLPWVAGLQWFGKIRKAVREGVMDEQSAALGYSAVLSMLSTTYVVLACAESLLLSA